MKIANRFLTPLAGLAAFGAWTSAAMAAAGHPVDWQMGLQDAVTDQMHGIRNFHDWLLFPIITVITLFVLGLLIYVMVKFNAKANPVPSKTTHNSAVEVAWTVIPILILVIIAVPSFRLLYLERVIPNDAAMTIKITGNPGWNWTYDYPDLGLNADGSEKVSFTAIIKDEAKDLAKAHAAGVPYLLATDNPVVVPVNTKIKIIVTSDPEGIIHAWTIPSFGVKIDAIPGRLNEDWFQVDTLGTYYGECSELCGKDHAFMPIEVNVVSPEDFKAWSEKAKTAGADQARDLLYAMLKAKGQLAQN